MALVPLPTAGKSRQLAHLQNASLYAGQYSPRHFVFEIMYQDPSRHTEEEQSQAWLSFGPGELPHSHPLPHTLSYTHSEDSLLAPAPIQFPPQLS